MAGRLLDAGLFPVITTLISKSKHLNQPTMSYERCVVRQMQFQVMAAG